MKPMKHILHTSALMGLTMMLAGAVVVACQKDPLDEYNPKTETITEAPFSLKGTEKRSDGGYILDWKINKAGINCLQEELNELTITPFNTFTFEAVPESACTTFPGINAKTNNACVKLERKSQSSFSISYVSDGDATITVWNGSQGGQTSITFKVVSRQVIGPEALRFIVDGKFVDLTTNYETGNFENKEAIFAYIGEAVTIDFKAYGKVLSSSKVIFASDGKSAVEGSFDSKTGKGQIVVKLNEKAGHSCSTVTLTIKGGDKDRTYTLDITAYYLDITAEDITLSGEKGQSAKLKYTIDTNITDFKPVIETEAQWLTIQNEILTATEENTTGETREAVVTLADKEGRFDKAQARVFQEAITAPDTKPGCVAFKEWNFKKACLAIADSDSDGEVSFEEAEAVEELVAVGKGIKDLTGLDAFKNLWKVDLRDNDIEDADILKELHLLHWLDLTGNKNLRTFDLTGCTIYFDYCWFECTELLQYKLLRHQVGISGGGEWFGKLTSDPWSEHSKHIRDERQTTDWSHQDNLIKVKSHTKTWVKDGQEMEYAVCLSGIGYLDVDIQDGTFKRMMDETIENLRTYQELAEKWEYLDIYYMEHLTDNRYKYMIPHNGQEPGDEDYEWAKNGWLKEWKTLEREMWNDIYGETIDINKILIPIDVNIHCLPHQEGFPGWISSILNYFSSSTDFQGKTINTKPHLDILTLVVSPFMDDENENFYNDDKTITNIFKSIPEGSFKDAVDVLF